MPAEDIAHLFDVEAIDIGPARFNIAPMQPILSVRMAGDLPRAERRLAVVQWGLIPWWAKPEQARKIAGKCVQARAETVTRTPAFRDAFKKHRCLVVVDGFYEWKTLPGGRRRPHHVRKRQGGPFAIGAVWDSWQPPLPEGAPPDAPKPERVESCAVLTTHAAALMKDLHDRMPLVLPADEWTRWLEGPAPEAARLLTQDERVLDERARQLVAVPVSTWVNDVRHEGPQCIEPVLQEIDEPTPRAAQIEFGFVRARR